MKTKSIESSKVYWFRLADLLYKPAAEQGPTTFKPLGEIVEFEIPKKASLPSIRLRRERNAMTPVPQASTCQMAP